MPRPLNLTLDLSFMHEREKIINRMREFGIEYVHGTNSKALHGLSVGRALWSRAMLDAIKLTPLSGEDGYTRLASHDQPVYTGVSLMSVFRYEEALHYSKLRLEPHKDGHEPFSVLLGISADIILSDEIDEHKLAKGSIPQTKIMKVIVPPGKGNIAKELLVYSGNLMSKIYEWDIFG